MLESELGVDIFLRQKGRAVRLTKPGEQIVALARGVLREAQRVKAAANEFLNEQTGELSVAATYMLARYALPGVYKRFVAQYPGVCLRLLQGTPEHVLRLAAAGEVDLAISTRLPNATDDALLLDYGVLPRVLVTPKRHPLLRRRSIDLEDIAEYPLIRVGRHSMSEAFGSHGLKPSVVFEDLEADIDVVKALTAAGLGVAVLPEIAYDARRDVDLRAIRVGHIFEPHTCCIALRRNHCLRHYMYAFIRMLAPQLDRAAVDSEFTLRVAPRRGARQAGEMSAP
jgi:LysR family cys regulon transcriptional activator